MTTDAVAQMLRSALIPTLLVGAVSAGVAGWLVGWPGVVGALIGLALVLAFFVLGLVVLRSAVRRLEPATVLLVALGLYAAKVVLIGGTLLILDGTGVLSGVADDWALGLTAIVCTLTWTTAQIRAAFRVRQPIFDLPAAAEPKDVA